MKKYFLLQTILAFLLTGCAMTDLKSSNYVGKVYKNTIQLPGMDIPLPEGEWCVIGSGNMEGKRIGGGSNYLTSDKFQVFLLKLTELGQIHSSIVITTDMMGNNLSGYLSNPKFKRTDVHHIIVKNNDDGGANDCWLIEHSIMSKSSSSKNSVAIKKGFEYLESNKMAFPKIMLQTYHYFTGKYNKNKYLTYEYLINPEIDGFDPPIDTTWATCEWSLSQVNKDPKKVEYIDKLKIEGAAMHEKLRVAFGE